MGLLAEGSLAAVLGGFGSGKSLNAVEQISKEYARGYRLLVTNLVITPRLLEMFPDLHVLFLTNKQMKSFWRFADAEAIVVIDEVHTVYEALEFKTEKPLYAAYWSQIRKTGDAVFVITQRWADIPIFIRDRVRMCLTTYRIPLSHWFMRQRREVLGGKALEGSWLGFRFVTWSALKYWADCYLTHAEAGDVEALLSAFPERGPEKELDRKVMAPKGDEKPIAGKYVEVVPRLVRFVEAGTKVEAGRARFGLSARKAPKLHAAHIALLCVLGFFVAWKLIFWWSAKPKKMPEAPAIAALRTEPAGQVAARDARLAAGSNYWARRKGNAPVFNVATGLYESEDGIVVVLDDAVELLLPGGMRTSWPRDLRAEFRFVLSQRDKTYWLNNASNAQNEARRERSSVVVPSQSGGGGVLRGGNRSVLPTGVNPVSNAALGGAGGQPVDGGR